MNYYDEDEDLENGYRVSDDGNELGDDTHTSEEEMNDFESEEYYDDPDNRYH